MAALIWPVFVLIATAPESHSAQCFPSRRAGTSPSGFSSACPVRSTGQSRSGSRLGGVNGGVHSKLVVGSTDCARHIPLNCMKLIRPARAGRCPPVCRTTSIACSGPSSKGGRAGLVASSAAIQVVGGGRCIANSTMFGPSPFKETGRRLRTSFGHGHDVIRQNLPKIAGASVAGSLLGPHQQTQTGVEDAGLDHDLRSLVGQRAKVPHAVSDRRLWTKGKNSPSS